MDNLQDLPEAQRIDYAPAQPKKRFPWMLLIASPCVALGAGTTVATMLIMARVREDPAVFLGFGVGFLALGGMLVLVHLRWK